MYLYYGSPLHFVCVLLPIALSVGLYFLLRNRSSRAKTIILSVLMGLNVIQHVFKPWIYPQYEGYGIGLLSTAYNVCAFLILMSPIALAIKCRPLRDLIFLVGSAAGIVAILVPYWDIGKDVMSLEFLRFFICHSLLFLTSTLSLSLGIHRPRKKDFPLLGLYFFVMLFLVLLNDAVCIVTGLHVTSEGVLETLVGMNPCWFFGAPEGFEWVYDIAKIFAPDAWVGVDGASPIPMLWYFIPMYAFITLCAYIVYRIIGTDKNMELSPNKTERDNTKFS